MAKGKLPEGYKGVEKLIKEFREKNPKGKIQTSSVVLEDGFVLLQATITGDEGQVGSGMALADVQEEKSVQKAESGAIRRALLTLGFESEEADEEDDKSEKEERREEKSERRSFRRDDDRKEEKKSRDDDKDDDKDEEEEEEQPRSRFGNKGSDRSEKRRDDDEEEEQEEGESRFKRGSRFERK